MTQAASDAASPGTGDGVSPARAVRLVVTGLVVLAAAIVPFAIGAIVADWAVRSVEATRSYPALTAALATTAAAAVVWRAVPWRRIATWSTAATVGVDLLRQHRLDRIESAADEAAARPSERVSDVTAEAVVDETADESADDAPGAADVAAVDVAAVDVAAVDVGAASSDHDVPVVVGVAPASRRATMSQRVRGVALTLVPFVAGVLVLHRDVIGHMSTRTIGFPGDREWYMFLSWKIGEAISSGSSPFFLEGITWPHGYNLLIGDGLLPPLAGGLLNLVFGPVTSYNLVLMLATSGTMASGWYLAGKVTDARWIRIVTALALASAPVVYVRYQGHLSLCFAFPVALVTAEVIDLMRGRPLRVRRNIVWLLLAFGGSFYFLLISAGVLTIGVLVQLWRDPPGRRSLVFRATAAALVAFAVVAPFLVERARFTDAELAAGSNFDASFSTDGIVYNADVLSIALPTYPSEVMLPGTERFQRNIVQISGEGNYSFPGLLLLLGGIGGLVLVRSRWRLPVLVSLAGLWVLTLGPIVDLYGVETVFDPAGARVQWMPYELLGKLPLMSGLRAPGRLSLGIPALLAAGLAVGLESCRTRSRSGRGRSTVVAAMACTGVMLFNIPHFTTSRLTMQTTSAQRMLESLADRPGPTGRVAPVPSCEPNIVGIEASLQVWHGLEQVGCQGPYLALPFASEMDDYRTSPDLAALRCRPDVFGYVTSGFPADFATPTDGLTDLRERFGVRYLVVNRSYLPNCPRVADVVAQIGAQYETLVGDDQWIAIDLDMPTP